MILSIVLGILGVILVFWLVHIDRDFGFMYSFVIILSWVFISVFFLAFGNAIPESEQNIVLKDTIYIEALQDNRDVTGRFYYLGRGRIETKEYYYYVVNTDKGRKVDKIEAENAYIIYSNETKIETYSSVGFKNKSAWIYAIPNYSYKLIYIPQDSITTEFNVDLE